MTARVALEERVQHPRGDTLSAGRRVHADLPDEQGGRPLGVEEPGDEAHDTLAGPGDDGAGGAGIVG